MGIEVCTTFICGGVPLVLLLCLSPATVLATSARKGAAEKLKKKMVGEMVWENSCNSPPPLTYFAGIGEFPLPAAAT